MGKSSSEQIPLLEWISAAVGLVITLTLLGYLVFETVTQSDGVPPLLDVVPVGLTAGAVNYVVEVKVANASDHTAAGVQIEGTLKQGGSEVETSSATLAYVPGESRRRAGLVFTRDPRKYQLQLRVTGYERP